MDACIVLVHGSENSQAAADLEALLALVRNIPELAGLPVTGASLRLASPNLPTVVRQLYGAGCIDIRVVPLFLFAGNHVAKDIPRLCKELESAHAGLRLTLAPHIGADPLLAQLICQRLIE